MEYESKIYIFQSKEPNIFENELSNFKNKNENIPYNNIINKFLLFIKFIIFASFLITLTYLYNKINIKIDKNNKNNLNKIFNNCDTNKELTNITEENMNINNNNFPNTSIIINNNNLFNITNNGAEFIDNNNIIKNYSQISMHTQKKIYWKDETMNIELIHNEIKNYSQNISVYNKEYIYERNNPKITIIITLFNQINFIHKIYSCIQNQLLKDIEIIFVDDASEDNSSIIVNELMEKDKRIIYIKNPINRGQFYSRNKGVLSSKGEYITIIDPDDLLLNNILLKAYETAKLYNLEVVQYYHMIGSYENNTLFPINITGILYPPYIKDVFFNCSDRYLWDKLIKREIFIKSIEFMKESYRNERFAIHNDELACFGVCKVANSYGVLEQIGYFYNRFNPNSTTKRVYKLENINERFHSLFTIMKYYYEQTDNNMFEKTMGYNFFMLRIVPRNRRMIKYLTKGFFNIKKVLDLYINSPFFDDEQKKNLKIFRHRIIKRVLNLTKTLNISVNQLKF